MWQKLITKSRRLASWTRSCLGFFPLTFPGLLLLLVSAATCWYQGIGQQDLVLLAAGFLGCVVIFLMALLVSAVALPFHLGCRKAGTGRAITLECGATGETGFRARIPRRLPLVDCTWTWETPRDVEVRNNAVSDPRVEAVTACRRGTARSIRRRILVKDVLGLSSLSWAFDEQADLRMVPSRGALDSMALLDGLCGGDDLSDPRGTPEGDRVDMRQYTQGDSPRTILWKVFAHTRKLLVRVPERAITAKPRSCAYFVSGEGDEPGAGLARVILERGILGDNWRFGADGSAGFTGHLSEALEMLIRSGNADASAGTGFPGFLRQAQKDGFSACGLIVPPKEGIWIPQVASAIAASMMRVYAYTVADKVTVDPEQSGALARLFCIQGAAGARRIHDLTNIARGFSGASFPFLLIDRQTGRVLGDIRSLNARRKKTAGGAR